MTVTAPYVDESATYGPASFASPSSITAPFLDGGVGFGPSVSEVGTDAVSILVDGSAVTGTFAQTFRDQIADSGTFRFSMLRVDFAASSIDFDQEVQFVLDGTAQFLGIVEQIEHYVLEGADEIVTISGRGALAVLDQDLVRPSRGVGALPIEEVRSFSWPSIDYSSTSWPWAKKVNRQREYADWRSPVPWIWPDTTGYWIWANQSDVNATYAPAGVCLFRKTITLADDATVRIFVAADNHLSAFYVDGANMTSFSSFTVGRYIELELSAGDHMLAAKVNNDVKATLPNPGGFICAVYTVGDSGLLDTLVTHTSDTWRCLPYPTAAPGFTHGEVLIKLLEEAQAEDALTGVSWDFTEELDSAGNPWSEYKEITVQVGRTLLEVIREMADAYIDVAMAPGSKVLRAWNRGDRGTTRSTTLQKTTDADTSDFLDLRHQGRHTRMNAALIRYAEGHTDYEDASSVTTYGRRSQYLEVGSIQGETEAKQVTAQLIANRSAPSFSTTARLLPHNDAATPYKGYAVADTITCPDENDDAVEMRVAAITFTRADDDAVIEWDLELRDQRYTNEERFDSWLRRMADGAALAGARVSSPAGTPAPITQQVTALRVAEFSFDNTILIASLSPKRPAEASGNMVEIVGQLTTAGSTTTTVRVLFTNGITGATSTLGSNLTFAAGVTETEVALSIQPVRANIDKLQCEIVTAGTGSEGLDVQVRAI